MSLPLLRNELIAFLSWSCFARLAAPDLDAVAHQDPDRARVPQERTVQGGSTLLRRHDWTCQVLAHRAVERDEAAVAGWTKGAWLQVEVPWRRSTPDSSSRTKPDSR